MILYDIIILYYIGIEAILPRRARREAPRPWRAARGAS